MDKKPDVTYIIVDDTRVTSADRGGPYDFENEDNPFLVGIIAVGAAWRLWVEWPEVRAERDEDNAAPAIAAASSETPAPQQSGNSQRTYNFDDSPAGQLPPNFHVALTGEGPKPTWVVQPDPSAPSKPNALAQSG